MDRDEIMRDVRKKKLIMSLTMAVIMSSVMGILFVVIARKNATPQQLEAMAPLPVMLISSLIESIVTGVIVALVIPFGKLGEALAARLNAKVATLKFNLINSFPFAVGNAIIVGAVCSFISIAQAHSHMPKEAAPPLFNMWLGQWLKTLPLSIIVSYVLAIIVSPIVFIIIQRSSKSFREEK